MSTGVPKTKWKSDITQYADDHGFSMDVSLSYEGKLSEEDILKTKAVETRVLWEGSENNENRLYFGDNLPVLASLLRDPSVKGKVRLVYIDPPFATNSVFQSRSQTDAYCDLLAGAHYIEFLRRRLILLRELIADDGSIYVHLDENMAFHIKVAMDEIFGRRNFRNWITRKKCNPKNYTRKTYGNVSDFILFYTKSESYRWNRPVAEWTPERAEKEYQYVEKETGRRYKKVPIHAPGTRNGETGKVWKEMKPPPGKHWQFTPRTLDEMDARGEIYWSPNGNPRRKIYLDESEGVPIQDIWLEFRDAHNQNVKITGYPTEKNPDMIARIIEASSNRGDLVLDCFAGSGTTLVVASQMERKWIGIDNSPEALATTLRRFSEGTHRMGDFVSKEEEKPAPQNYSLFDSVEPDATENQSNSTTAVRDFVLYAACDYQELESIPAKWKKWL